MSEIVLNKFEKEKKVMQELLYFFCKIRTLLLLINRLFPITRIQDKD